MLINLALFMHSQVDDHLSYYHFGAIMNKITETIQVIVWMFSLFLGKYKRERITRSYSKSFSKVFAS